MIETQVLKRKSEIHRAKQDMTAELGYCNALLQHHHILEHVFKTNKRLPLNKGNMVLYKDSFPVPGLAMTNLPIAAPVAYLWFNSASESPI